MRALPAGITVCVYASDLAKFTGHNGFVREAQVEQAFWATNPRLAKACGVDHTAARAPCAVTAHLESLPMTERATIAKQLGVTEDGRANALAADKTTLSNIVCNALVTPAVRSDGNVASKAAGSRALHAAEAARREAAEGAEGVARTTELARERKRTAQPVSYTHLTLPTILLV